MSFEQIQELSPLLEHIDSLQAQVDALKVAHPDVFARIMKNWNF